MLYKAYVIFGPEPRGNRLGRMIKPMLFGLFAILPRNPGYDMQSPELSNRQYIL